MQKLTIHVVQLSFLVLVAVLGGMYLNNYSSNPGESGQPAMSLGAPQFASTVDGTDSTGTLLVAIHPRCPCTLATANELARISTRFPKPVAIQAFIYCPPNEPDFGADTAIVDVLSRISSTEVIPDLGGAKALELGMRTSGHVLYYGPDGRLSFSGGITSGRGHEGLCRAASELLRIIADSQLPFGNWPVFGCPLFADADEVAIQ